MRIGIDASTWNNNRGYGRFTRELVTQMIPQGQAHQFVLLADEKITLPGSPENLEIVIVGSDRTVVESAVADGRRGIGDILAFRKAAKKLKLDALFYPTVYSWFPPPSDVVNVLTIHDAIAEKFPELVFPQRKQRAMWNAKTWLARRAASHIVTTTNSGKADIVEYMNVEPGKISVVRAGANSTFSPVWDSTKVSEVRALSGLGEGQRAIVYVGGFAPHKNLQLLMDAFESVLMNAPSLDLKLVMVGDPGGAGFHSDYGVLQRKVASSEYLKNRVTFPGYISDEDMAALLSDALALVLPSVSEGFGLPGLEAISCGCPVIAAHGSAVMEVVGSAGLSFKATNVASLAQAIGQMASDRPLYDRLEGATITEAERNTWPIAAELTLKAIETTYQAKFD